MVDPEFFPSFRVSLVVEAAKRLLEAGDAVDKPTDDQIYRLLGNLEFSQLYIHDAEVKQGENLQIRAWLTYLQDVLYDAEDLCDEFATDIAVQALHGNDGDAGISASSAPKTPLINKSWGRKVSKSIFCCASKYFDHVNLLHRASDLKAINSKLDQLAYYRARLGLVMSSESSQIKSSRRPETFQVTKELKVFGRGDETERTIQILLDAQGILQETTPSSHNQLKSHISILPIIGMGGIGKTTLAQMVFNDYRIHSYFSVRAWVHVGDSSNAERVLEYILQTVTMAKEDSQVGASLEVIETEISKMVEGQRFLLVLDDVWSEDIAFWKTLLKPFKDASSGRHCVVVTSRLSGIANFVEGCMSPIRLNGLDDADIWAIFHENVFGDESHDLSETQYNQLVMMGKEIVKKFKGSPLAAKTTGKILALSYTKNHWDNIVECWQKILDQLCLEPSPSHDIIDILRLSHQQLPSHLKQCLTYFSLFPSDFEYEEAEIIHFWMAHGLLHCEDGLRVEDVGKKYLKDLEDRSFLQRDGGTLSMHDLIHDLIKAIARYDCFCIVDDHLERDILKQVRHISVHGMTDLSSWHAYISNWHKLRTLIICQSNSGSKETNDILGTVLENTKFLRVLVLKGCSMTVLPKIVCNLKHLRCLDLSYSNLESLPESLGFLQNLQILNLKSCQRLHDLPKNTTMLVNLRQLIVDFKELSPLHGIGRLSMLQNLNLFAIGKESGFGISELKNLNMLQGSVEIQNLEIVTSKEEAQKAQLDRKKFLERLELTWKNRKIDERESDAQHDEVQEYVLDTLQPSTYLKQICISAYRGSRPPCWLNDLWLCLLETLELTGCSQMVSLPHHLGKMPFLRRLKISDMCQMKAIQWGTTSMNDYGHSSETLLAAERSNVLFPALEWLHFSDMPRWVEWRVEEMVASPILPQLKSLYVKNCPRLELVSFPNLEEPKDLKVNIAASTAFSNGVNFQVFSSLTILRIEDCPNFASCLFPPVPMVLEELVVKNCKLLTAMWIFSDIAIHTFNIQNCPNLSYIGSSISLPSVRRQFSLPPSSSMKAGAAEADGHCFLNVTSLNITNCKQQQLVELLLQIPPAKLKYLEIRECSDIDYYHDGGDDPLKMALLSLTSLRSLHIQGSQRFKILQKCPSLS